MKFSHLFITIFIIFQFSCATNTEQLKFDSKGKILTFNIGKQDTIFFQENSTAIDSVYSESLHGLVNFVKPNNYKIFMRATTHEEEISTISVERLNEVENYLINLGIKKDQILKNTRTQIIPISQDTILTEDEKSPVRKVVLQIVK